MAKNSKKPGRPIIEKKSGWFHADYSCYWPLSFGCLSCIQTLDHLSAPIYWPWIWNWFAPDKDTKRHTSKHANHSLPVANSLMNDELPGNCYFGGCELLAGSLIAILPIPGAHWLGGIMIGDGVRRIVDGTIQLSDERRADPNYRSPVP